MSRRKGSLLTVVLLVAVLPAAVLPAGLIGVRWIRTRAADPGVTEANFRSIDVGMTEKQCRQILGLPKSATWEPPARVGIPAYLVVQWEEPKLRLTIEIVFNSSGRAEGGLVLKKTSQNLETVIASLNMGFVTDSSETLFARLRRWLRL